MSREALRRGNSLDERHRHLCELHDLQRDRAEEKTFDRAVAAVAHHDQVAFRRSSGRDLPGRPPSSPPPWRVQDGPAPCRVRTNAVGRSAPRSTPGSRPGYAGSALVHIRRVGVPEPVRARSRASMRAAPAPSRRWQLGCLASWPCLFCPQAHDELAAFSESLFSSSVLTMPPRLPVRPWRRLPRRISRRARLSGRPSKRAACARVATSRRGTPSCGGARSGSGIP